MIPSQSSLDVAPPSSPGAPASPSSRPPADPIEHTTALALVLLLAHLRDSGEQLPPGPHGALPERVHHLLHLVIARVEVGVPPPQTAATPDEASLAAFITAIPLDWARLTRATERDLDDGHDAFFEELTAQLDVALTDGASA